MVVLVGRSLLAGLVRAVAVVMSGVLAEDGPQVPFTVDEHPVGALGSCAAYPPLGIAIRARRPRRVLTVFTPSPLPLNSVIADTRGPLPRLPAQAKKEPGVPIQRLLREIREQGYPGSSNLLVRYINQGRLDTERPHIAPRKATQILLTNPDNLPNEQRETAGRLSAAAPR